MTHDDIEMVARWLTDHGFTVVVDYEAQTVTIRLGPGT